MVSDCCIESVKDCIIRGDTWQFVVSLDDGWAEVLAEPGDYVMKLVLRDDQNDSLTPRLELTVSDFEIVTPVPVIPGQPRLFATFNATVAQTTALPTWDLVGYVELRTTNNSYVRRLVELQISIED